MSRDLTGPADGFFDQVLAILREARGRAYRRISLAFPDPEKPYAMRRELSWSQYVGDQPGKGFSVANPKNLRLFCLNFPEPEKRYTLRSELSWSHIRLIMRIADPKDRDSYIWKRRSWTGGRKLMGCCHE